MARSIRRTDDPNINHIGTVYNGLSMNHFPSGAKPEDFLLFVGRVSMEKGTHIAIQVAQELDMELIIAAKVDVVGDDRIYFRDYIEPNLSGKIRWIGEVDETERNNLMSRALCLLHPVTWREPFGLVLIEAMACGCPVIAFNLGAIPEVIQSGKTGFVVQDVEEMIESVEHIGKIDRSYCREYALSNFNAEKMTKGYEEIYSQMISP